MDHYAHKDSIEIVRALVVEADNASVLADWCDGVAVEEIDPFNANIKFPALNVPCGDNVKRASLGDYVLKHDDGSFDVKKPIEFARNYEALRWEPK